MRLRTNLAVTVAVCGFLLTKTAAVETDVCIYGATPAGVVAAVAAKQEGMSVVLIEPSRWVGGILGAGIKPKQDCADQRAVGGLTKSKVFVAGNDPPSIRESFDRWLKEEGIPVIYEHRVQRVEKDGQRITRIHLEYAPPDELGVPAPFAKPGPGKTIEAKVFIDASYEGDLMAGARVPYAVGREPSDKFNEKPAGVGDPTNWRPIDPYCVPGKPESGLLPLVEADHGKPKGAGDDYTQAYNFRYYVTSDPARRVPFTPPADYDPKQFELVGRYVQHIMNWAGGNAQKAMPRLSNIFPGWRNSGEYNYQRQSLVTMAPLGVSRFYQDGDWATRSKVWRQHIDYLRGLHHFLSTDPRVPELFRTKTAELGLDKTMHPNTQGWPHQLYVRITRRMQSAYILTHADVLNQTRVDDAVGLALYGVDTYPVRRYAARDPETGALGVATEGNMFIGGSRGTGVPYAVPYRAITPKAEACVNLLVPVCFSASYIAYASARMEPVFCVLGESAGVAAAQAVRDAKPVQAIDVKRLQERLLQRGQVLEWKPVEEADICVYGGTSGGVAAAVQAARMGKKAIIVEPGKHLGGMTAGGLSAVDIGDPRSVGGIAREYFTKLAATVGTKLAWDKPFVSKGGGPATGGAYAIEPHKAEQVFNDMARKAKVSVHFNARLASVKKNGGRITELVMEDGAVFRAKMFIDATYEGDLMAKAGVSYTLMREGNAKYGETYNGIHYADKYKPRTNHLKPGPTGRVPGGQGVWDRDFPLDPYIVPGDPKSGLLPLVQAGDPGNDGDPAPGVQAYCFRLCLTTNANRIFISPPSKYDPKRYEVVARFIAACLAIGDDMDLRWFSKHDPLPNGKWDFNTATFGGNMPGTSWEWPEASYARREQIAKEHENYHRGLLHFLATDPRVPEKVRNEMRRFGLPRDEFIDNGGWPHQIYVREARRMVSDLVMTEHHTFGRKTTPQSVGLGSYGTDTHEIRRIVKDGVVAREGKTAIGRDGAPPYPIGYAAIVPKSSECENLFVTFTLSASHTAFSSIRMEPVFMILGQSAATAASIAIDDNAPVQKVDYEKLRERLLKDGQVLVWSAK